jgi:LL-H family phage holin
LEVFQPLLDILKSSEFQTAIANVLILTITGVAAAISRAIFGFVKTNTNERQFLLLQSIAIAAVRAAEQGELAGLVKDKKQSAFNIINAYIQQMGLTEITAEQIDAAIESAVLTQFNAYKTQPAPAFPFPFGPLPTPDEGEDGETPETGTIADAGEEANG